MGGRKPARGSRLVSTYERNLDENKSVTLNTPFTFGSLFSGIGGLDLGLERAGMQCAWQVEIDNYATKVLETHWPHVARFRDIRDCGATNLTPIDLICGGFPCQDISLAGGRAGITGARSGLWRDMYRIICELRPRYVLVENVSALLAPIKRSGYREPAPIARVLGDLAACGYDAEWQVLSAQAFGAPHVRERVFIVAYPTLQQSDTSQEHREFYEKGGTPSSPQWAYSDVADSDRIGLQTLHQQSRLLQAAKSTRRIQSANRSRLVLRGPIRKREIWADESGVRRVAHGIPRWMDRVKGLGNAVVPQIAEYIGQCILQAHHEQRGDA